MPFILNTFTNHSHFVQQIKVNPFKYCLQIQSECFCNKILICPLWWPTYNIVAAIVRKCLTASKKATFYQVYYVSFVCFFVNLIQKLNNLGKQCAFLHVLLTTTVIYEFKLCCSGKKAKHFYCTERRQVCLRKRK